MRRKWSRVSKLLVALGVVSGVAAFALVRGYAARLEALRPVAGSPISIVVAVSDLERGTQLTSSMVRVETVPSAFAPPGALREIEQAEGRTLVSDVVRDEPITATRLGSADSGPVAALVPPGLRAFTVQATVPAGSVRPGDLVDVLATFGGPRPYTETVATALEVLMVLGAAEAGGDGATFLGATGSGGGPSLVLLVSPDQAERLAYAKAFADLSVAIVGGEEGVGG